MRNCNRLLFLLASFFITGSASAQISGTNCFLQGSWVEIGLMSNAAFGASGGIPAGYHAHFAPNLGEVFDYGHDGWAVGAPPAMGDYTYPGYPFEGWGLQVNGGRTQAFWPGGFTSAGGGSLTGTITGYSNIAQRAVCNWTGTASGGGMQVRQETRVDTFADAVVVTTVMVNTTGTAMPAVYYLRSCDPDNNQSWPGGSFTTNNIVTYQNDSRHRVLASATSAVGPASYLGLGTKDCRAKAFIYNWWPMPIAVDFADMWNQTVLATYSNYYYDNINHPGDIGFGLIYNIGTIAAGDSAIVSYAYVFSNPAGLDATFPDPQIVVNGTGKPVIPPPAPNYDTFISCHTGLTSIPVDFKWADDKCWSWSKWTWAPGIGLATTTGIHNTITFAGLPAVITYTITGTDSGSHMYSCNQKIFYLTIISCNGAVANSPCVNDTLFLNAPGDSLGATYRWYGPAPSTATIATTQAFFRFPALITDTGTYSVIKTIAGVPDTATVDVTIYQLPALTLTTNQANCAPVVGALSLTCTPDSICTSFAWTGPSTFTSSMQNPVINPFDSSKEGTYFVSVISNHGCKKTNSVLVKPGPTVDFSSIPLPGCPQDSGQFHTFGASNVSVFQWDFSNGTGSFDPHPLHIFSSLKSGVTSYPVTLKVTSANGCTISVTHTLSPTHSVTAGFSTTTDKYGIADTVCLGSPIHFTDISTALKFGSPNMPIANYDWNFGSDGGTGTGITVDHTYPDATVYNVKLTVTDNLGCTAETKRNMVVLDPHIRMTSDTTFCLVRPLVLYNTVYLDPKEPFTYPGFEYSYAWSDPYGLSSTIDKEPAFNAIGIYTYTMIATISRHGCSDTATVRLNSILPTQLHHITIDSKIKYGNSIQLYCDSEYLYKWTPDDGSLNNPNINNPIATPSVTTTYTVFGMDKYGCRDTAQITIRVDSTQNEHTPTGFTPNGDGLNDVFRFNGGKYQKMLEMRVYNRWGEQVFYSTTREVGWDGTYKGVPADMGVYYYNVVLARPGYPDNTVIKGEVTLIR